ncbi:MAG TPA: ATP-binding cassette domain-containing protein [Frankiaceae bacterium]|nr:ATP-binding cassette domain-containing protein [Frankiaceae bacterium]
MRVIEVSGVHKTYTRLRKPPQRAIDNLDLVVEEGGVHGFLGPNGSGKTTTIRMILGLVEPDAGEVRLLGEPVPQGLPDVISEVGALVETPLFFPNFSGRLNLELLAQVAGLPRDRVDESLDRVGLTDRADDRVKAYSLGMKQRLGIAAALMKRPRLLILDEPSNGLDPAGIREVRELIRALGSRGVTVFLSSHLLGEVEQVCDTVDILVRGRRIASGSVQEVLATKATGQVRVRTADIALAARTLEAAGMTVAPFDDHLLVYDVADPATVTKALAQKRQYVTELVPITANLESVFLELTEGAA